MEQQEIEQRVMELVLKQAGRSDVELTRATHFRDDLEFDSLDFVDLTMKVEETFRLSVPDEDAETLQTVGELIDYVVGRLSDAPAAA